jgi:hypothetical protein
MKTLNLLTLTLIAFASFTSFTFADHDHLLMNCQTETYQEWVDGAYTTQYVPATYRTVRVFDTCTRAYTYKQVIATPASYQKVWVAGHYETKSRTVCNTAPVCDTTPSYSSNSYFPTSSFNFPEICETPEVSRFDRFSYSTSLKAKNSRFGDFRYSRFSNRTSRFGNQSFSQDSFRSYKKNNRKPAFSFELSNKNFNFRLKH